MKRPDRYEIEAIAFIVVGITSMIFVAMSCGLGFTKQKTIECYIHERPKIYWLMESTGEYSYPQIMWIIHNDSLVMEACFDGVADTIIYDSADYELSKRIFNQIDTTTFKKL